MKTNRSLKNFGLCLIAAMLFTMIFACMTVSAETRCPDCGAILSTGATLHSDDHNLSYEKLDKQLHYATCWTCALGGHNEQCYKRTKETAPHNFKVTSSTAKTETKECQDCGYSETNSTCKHEDVRYMNIDRSTHKKWCFDCGKDLEVLKHSWSKTPTAAGDYQGEVNYHIYSCSVCDASYNEDHKFVTTYTQLPQSPVYYKNSTRADKHQWTTTCTTCGYKKKSNIGYNEDHTFNGGTCTKCKYKKVILGKPKNGKGKQTKKVKIKKGIRKAYSEWDKRYLIWRHYPTMKYTDRTYTIKLTWGKVKDAKGYYVTETKLAPGTATVGIGPNDTTKTSMTLKCETRNKALKKKVYYVYPVNIDCVLGTPAVIKTSLRG